MDLNAIYATDSTSTVDQSDIEGFTTISTQESEHSTLHFHTELQGKMQDEIKNITHHIETITQSLRELQSRLDDIQQCTKNKSPGCGFSCSNNSFAL